MEFGDLPPELIEHILCYLLWTDIIRCRRLCRYMLNLIDSSGVLQLRIELARDGMKLNPDAVLEHRDDALSVRRLIDRAEDRRNALRYPVPRLQRVLDCPHTGRYPFEICDGVWGRADNQIGDYFYQLRYDFLNPIGDPTLDKSHVHELDVPIDDFIFWVAGDLQILLEERDQGSTRRLYFRTFSKNLPHPSARLPFLDILRKDCDAWEFCVLHLYADRVGIVLTQSVWQSANNVGGVIVWDWVNGEMILPYTRTLDAAFISRDYILRLVDAGDSLALAVTPFNSAEVVQILRLPVTDNFYGAHFVPHPFYNTGSDFSGASLPDIARRHLPIFTPDATADILVLEHQYKQTEDERNGHLMVISVKHLMDRCKRSPPGSYSFEPHSTLPRYTTAWEWDEWSPQIARLLPYGMGKASRRAVFGSKLLVAAPLDLDILQNRSNITSETVWLGAQIQLILLDFNTRSLSLQIYGENSDENLFEDDVSALERDISRWDVDRPLPYSTASNLKFCAAVLGSAVDYLNVYLDADGFVGRKEDCYDIFSFIPPRESHVAPVACNRSDEESLSARRLLRYTYELDP